MTVAYPSTPDDMRKDPFSAEHHEHEARTRQRDDPTYGRSLVLRTYPCGCEHRNVDDGRDRPKGWKFCDYHRDGRDLEEAMA